jgi:3,4-dihydroxy 2-butanone 4-phosphate synthase/GTP cyclohydrolase II
MSFCTVEQAISLIQQGKLLIVVDDENRENEGDFFLAAQHATTEKINFLIKEARGLICAPMPEAYARQRGLGLMEGKEQNTSCFETAFTVSVDAKKDVSTGISASDRAQTLRVLAEPDCQASQFDKPGHIFPLIAKDKGVLERPGHTEAMVDLLKLAQIEPVGVICEILNDDGTMARMPDLELLAERFNIPILKIEDLVQYRRKHELIIQHKEFVHMPTEFGEFTLHLFENPITNQEVVVLAKGEIDRESDLLVRIHSSCVTGDLFHSLRCDCREQLHTALKMIESEGKGLVVYLNQEGRGIGLSNKLKAYRLQEQGLDTVDANLELGLQSDLREYWEAFQVLKFFSIGNIRLLTNNPKKINALKELGMEVLRRPVHIQPNEFNEFYLSTKQARMGHLSDPTNLVKKPQSANLNKGDQHGQRQIH